MKHAALAKAFDVCLCEPSTAPRRAMRSGATSGIARKTSVGACSNG
ncbi:hypothetical protein [Chelatococcus asaccharovorans]|uniref:Uncharacterized protein n=1 Tax=Chelatococcus asaccharovorans TaxID=28210 RepID=A0A2V3UBH4_9HYPH|nr:hypothetical protein [Chelatococcus asaccharovorans]PXW61807.1 hypothetical protein C7450_103325 [Chelatococcus asaccharovorans]